MSIRNTLFAAASVCALLTATSAFESIISRMLIGKHLFRELQSYLLASLEKLRSIMLMKMMVVVRMLFGTRTKVVMRLSWQLDGILKGEITSVGSWVNDGEAEHDYHEDAGGGL
jgi:hypothetical protein